MNRDEINRKLGLSEEELVTRAQQFESDTWKREEFGNPITGRPLAFGEPMRPVTFKEPLSIIAAMDAKAHAAGISRSDYLRRLVEKDLTSA